MKTLLVYLLFSVGVALITATPAQAQRGYRGGRGYYRRPVPRHYYPAPRPYYGPRYYHAEPYRSHYGRQYYRRRPEYGRPGYYRQFGPPVIIRR